MKKTGKSWTKKRAGALQKKKGLALLLVPAMCIGLAAPAFAAPTGPEADHSKELYDEQVKAALDDNVIEYSEIAMRVRDYNPAISDAWRQFQDTESDYQGMLTELESEYRKVEKLADSYRDAGKALGSSTPAGHSMISAADSLQKGYQSSMDGVRSALNGWDSKKNTATLRQAERQVVAGVQQAMIGYDTICQNITTLQTMVQLYQQQSAAAQRMQQLGMATESDLLNANKALLGAQSQLASLQSQQESTRRTLCELLGYDPDSNPEIRPIPEFDMSRIAGMDLAADTKKAIGNNTTLISQRTSAKGGTSAQVAARLASIEDGEQKLTIEMERLYNDVMDKKAAYEAAQTGFAGAQQQFDGASLQYQLGMLSQPQYIAQELAYYQKKAARDSANLSLLQAMETYDWAIAGQATVD